MAVLTLTTNNLIDLIDLLQVGSISCEATTMASSALDHDHRDAISYLARDTQNTIEAARQKLQEWIDAAHEGRANG